MLEKNILEIATENKIITLNDITPFEWDYLHFPYNSYELLDLEFVKSSEVICRPTYFRFDLLDVYIGDEEIYEFTSLEPITYTSNQKFIIYDLKYNLNELDSRLKNEVVLLYPLIPYFNDLYEKTDKIPFIDHHVGNWYGSSYRVKDEYFLTSWIDFVITKENIIYGTYSLTQECMIEGEKRFLCHCDILFGGIYDNTQVECRMLNNNFVEVGSIFLTIDLERDQIEARIQLNETYDKYPGLCGIVSNFSALKNDRFLDGNIDVFKR